MNTKSGGNRHSGATDCSTSCELSMTLAGLRTAEAAVRDEPYERLPALAGTLAMAAHRMEVLSERCDRIEAALSYALTVERSNTEEWMTGLRDRINQVLVADGDHRRCTYDGNELRLRSVRQVLT